MPDTKVSLVGENEGAAVVSEIAWDIGAGKGVIDADHVAGVATFADPTRSEDQPTIASGSKKAGKAPGTVGRMSIRWRLIHQRQRVLGWLRLLRKRSRRIMGR